jgi:hypothetical protein
LTATFAQLAHNGWRANEGRETKALNCKPITNLKEKYELSNYCKTSGFRLHAVSGWCLGAIYTKLKTQCINYFVLKFYVVNFSVNF